MRPVPFLQWSTVMRSRGSNLAQSAAMPGRIAPVFALLMCLAIPAAGQTKTDVVTLRNGDRVTGDIVKLSRGRLEVRTNDVGTVNIEWDKVAKVEAARYFEVVTT